MRLADRDGYCYTARQSLPLGFAKLRLRATIPQLELNSQNTTHLRWVGSPE